MPGNDNLSIQKNNSSQVNLVEQDAPIKAQEPVDKVQLAKDLLAKLELKLENSGDPINFSDTQEDRDLIDGIRAFEFKDGVRGESLLEVETYMHHQYDLEKIANKLRAELPQPPPLGYNLSKIATELYVSFEQVRVIDANDKLTSKIAMIMGQLSRAEKVLAKINQKRMSDGKKNDQLDFNNPEDKKLIDEIRAYKFTNEMGDVLISGDNLFDAKDPYTYKGDQNISRLSESITNHIKMNTGYVQQNEILLSQNFHMMRDVVQASTTATKGQDEHVKNIIQKTPRHG